MGTLVMQCTESVNNKPLPQPTPKIKLIGFWEGTETSHFQLYETEYAAEMQNRS